jgi:hypothetical protein
MGDSWHWEVRAMNLQFQLPSGIRWSGMLVGTVLCASAGAVVLLQHSGPLLLDIFRPSASIDAVDVTTPLLAQHEATQGTYESRFAGRSLFFAPQDWKRKIPPPPPPPPPSPPPPPPQAPTEYSGPKVVGMLGSTVYLEGARTVEIGKDAEGITLVEIISPWMVKIRHKGKEYEVAVGQKMNEANFKPLTSASTPSGVTVEPATGAGGVGTRSGASPAGTMVTKTATPPGAAGAVAGAGAGGVPSGTGANGAAAGASGTAGAGGAVGASGASGASGAGGAGAGGAPNAADTAPVLNSTPAVPPIPPATTQVAVSRLEVEPARTALAQVAAARGRPDLNEATRQRLEAEEQWLVQRLEDLTR